MAFKSVEQFNGDRYHGMFRLVNDGDHANVIFLYRSKKDMLVAQAHYIKSADYSGYVHCCEQGCPACSKGIRVQTKLFIPILNLDANDGEGEIQFWDRTLKFEPQFQKDVFDRYPNPSEFVFTVTRHGIPNDVNTTYSIEAVYRNSLGSYDTLLSKYNAEMPDYYSEIIREVSTSQLADMLKNAGNESAAGLPEYTPIPRSGYQANMPETFVDTSEATSIQETVQVHFDSPKGPDTSIIPEDTDDDSDSELPNPIF